MVIEGVKYSNKLADLTGKSSLYVKNSAHFKERISNAPIHSNQMLCLDVVCSQRYVLMRHLLTADLLLKEGTYIPIDNPKEMLTFCVKITYFRMGSDLYRPKDGLAMGSTLSVFANIFMEYFKEITLGSISLKPSMWLRYVDVTFILWSYREDVQTLLDQVNSIRPSIQFIMKKELDNKLPFLDVLVIRKDPDHLCIVSLLSQGSTSISTPTIHVM